MTRVISFSSGKGGVGKTTLVANLGALWAKQGKRVLLLDGDWTLGKLSLMFGARPQWTIEKVLQGEITVKEAVTNLRSGLHLLASPTGIVGFEELGESLRHQLLYEIESLNEKYDLILFDHSSGVHWGVLPFAAASHQHVVVTTAEPTSYTDAYAIMKILSKRFKVRDFVVVNMMASDRAESEAILSRFVDTASSHLNIRVSLLDTVQWEPKVNESIRRQQAFVDLFPLSELTFQFERMTRALESLGNQHSHGLRFFYGDSLIGDPAQQLLSEAAQGLLK